MTGLTRDRWHRYSWNGEGPLLGVTTALKIQDALIGGDLARWGGEIAARYAFANPDATVADALAAVSAQRDIGTEVHAQIEAILLGQPATPTERTAPYIYSFSAFLAAERPDFAATEQRIVNLTHRYAGTFDFAATLPLRGRGLALVDVKTGKSRLAHRLQLAGYAAGEFVGIEGDPERHPMLRFRRYYTLLLRPDGYELVEQRVTAAERRHFLYLVGVYRRLRAWDDAAKKEEPK